METRLAGPRHRARSRRRATRRRYAPIAYLAADPEAEPSQRAGSASRASACAPQGLQRALASLDARSRRIIEARWLTREGPARRCTTWPPSSGVSAERIRQIEAKAMEKMKQLMQPLRGDRAHCTRRRRAA